MDFVGGLVSGIMGLGQTAFNNWLSQESAAEAREANYQYNERAAINAYYRQRQLYNDFYSPQALMRQYKQAGLSPSLMFGGNRGKADQQSHKEPELVDYKRK